MQPVKILSKYRVPLVGVELPEVELPEFPPKPPELDDRKREVLKHAVLEDLSDLVPAIGDPIADLHYAEVRKKLTPEEYEVFVEENKGLPSSIAAVRTFMRRG